MNNKCTMGFFINSDACKGTNLSKILDGNPGIGGTEYTTLVLALLLFKNGFDIVIYSKEVIDTLPKGLLNVCQENKSRSLLDFDLKFGGVFIYFPSSALDMPFNILKKTKVIVWRHVDNYEKDYNRNIVKYKNVYNVFLTKEQAFSYCIFKGLLYKSVIIGHFTFPEEEKELDMSRLETNNVTFVGNIGPVTSFDTLARAWPKVIKKVSDAHLFVCGSGSLYGNNIRLGPHKIATEEFEKKIFMPLIKKRVLDSVSFLGKLSNNDIKKVIMNTKVGVVNPHGGGLHETFCLSALDFASLGVPVVGGNYGGLVDTIPKQCGFRVRSEKQLVRKICDLLSNNSKNKEYGQNYYKYASTRYSLDVFAKKWANFIKMIQNNYELTQYSIPLSKYIKYNFEYKVKRLSLFFKKIFRIL